MPPVLPNIALPKSQGEIQPFYYIDGVSVNPWDNSNPSGCIQVKRTYAILQSATEWDLAIIRATYPMNAIPLGICPMLVGATVQTTPMTFTMTRSGTPYTASVLWVPEYTDQPVPTNTSVQDLTTRYY